MTLLFNHKAGPWDQAGFLQQARQALADLKGFDSCENIFFVHYFEQISREQKTHEDPDFGSAAHMQKTWELMLEDPCWSRKGTKVKWSRWGSMFDSGGLYMSRWFSSLPVMLTLAWQRKWWKHASACPIFQQEGEDAVIAGLVTLNAATSGGTAAPRTVKDAEVVQETLRAKHKNAFHLCCSIQSNLVSQRLFTMIMKLGGIARHLMGASIKRIEKGPESALQTYLSWAQGDQHRKFKELLRTLNDQKTLADTGFEWMQKDEAQQLIAEVDVRTEDEMAQRYVLILRELVANLGLSSLDYSDNFPHMFVLLLQTDETKRQEAMGIIKESWLALQHLEHESSHAQMHAYARSLLWPSLTSVRAIFVSLQEQDWKLTQETRRLIELTYSTPLQTTIIEDAFNVLEDRVSVCKSRRLEKMNMLHSLFDSRLVKTYGRKPLQCEGVQELPAKLPKSVWTNDAEEFSVGGKVGLQGLAHTHGWQTCSPQAACLLPLAVRAMRLATRQESGWVSLLTGCLCSPRQAVCWRKTRAGVTMSCEPPSMQCSPGPAFLASGALLARTWCSASWTPRRLLCWKCWWWTTCRPTRSPS